MDAGEDWHLISGPLSIPPDDDGTGNQHLFT